jgi:two-component system LytT family sensor kinase
MKQLRFVFSSQPKWILVRHFSFWLCWYVFQVYLYSFTPSPILNKLSFWVRIQINAGESFFYLIPNIFLAYMLMYVVIPRMVLPAKYFVTFITVLFLLFITGGISALVSLTVIEYMRLAYLARHPSIMNGVLHTPFNIQLYLAWISGLRGSITIGGLAAAIKLMKYFYEKQQQALILQQEKTLAELQSLKAQLHPHFLFNTLNNIYANTQDTAPVAADMVLGLSELLRYILYTCNAPLVPLAKEVTMMLEYIELEKKRYGNELKVAVQIPSDYQNLVIAPLLILPFVENCFKHGASDMLDAPWINIHIALENEGMNLKVVNGKSPGKVAQTGGIGIENVRRRLQLLYPDQHQLSILSEEEIYIVNLKVQLTRAEPTSPVTKNTPHELTSI